MISIVYRPNIIINLTGNTIDYSTVNSAITFGIYINSGFTLNLYEFDNYLFNRIDVIDNIINYVNGVNKYQLNVLIVNTGDTFINVTQTGLYCVQISYLNNILDYLMMDVYYFTGSTSIVSLPKVTPSVTSITTTHTTTIPIIIQPTSIVYKNVIILTGNTTGYSGITSGITITTGFTFNLDEFYNNTIDRVDIINNIVNYVDGINKYQLDILIVNTGATLINVTQTGLCCVKFSFGDLENYLLMNVYTGTLHYIPPTIIGSETTTTTTTLLPGVNRKKPFIFYNQHPVNDAFWIGSGLTVPYDVTLELIHNNITGWTLNSLQTLFISGITDCFDGYIPLSSMSFILYKNGSNVPLNGITASGIYNIYISVIDSAGNNTIQYILHIIVDNEPPIIVYRPYVIMNITGNTSSYSGASSGFTPNIYITSGFTFNLNEFDKNTVTRLDIIDNIISYAYDSIDVNVNKYMINILMASKHNNFGPIVYTGVTLPGQYCVKISLSDNTGNEIIQYFMMNVIYDISVYSEGFWQDNKVWIDFVLWRDHPKNPYV